MLNMKNKLAKRIMAFVLSGAMVISGLAPSGMTAYAAEASTETVEEYVDVEETEENDAEVVSDTAKEETPDEDSGADAKEEDDAAEDVNEEASPEEAAKENASTREVVEEVAESTAERRTQENDDEVTIKEEVNKAESFKLEPISLELQSSAAESDLDAGEFRITSGYIVNDGNRTATNGVNYTRRIRISSSSVRIYFTTEGAGKLTVYLDSTGSSARTAGVYKADQTAVEEKDVQSGLNEFTYNIPEAGEYYITGGGINVYYVEFIGNESGDTPPQESSSVEESSSTEASSEEDPIPDSEKHTVWVVGDSTVSAFEDNYYYPRYGYGTQIQNYLDGYYKVENLAMSGRSSTSFTSEKNYETLKSGIKEGDYLIVGFGHNDQKAEIYTSPVGNWETEGSFAKSLYDNYVKIAYEAGATTIICTPIVRRTTGSYTGTNIHITSEGSYPDAIKQLGEDKKSENLYVVDLTTLTKELYESLGNDETLYLHAWTKPKETSVDNTHINIYGAKVVAKLLATEISKFTDLPIAEHLKNLDVELSRDKDLISNPGYTEPEYTPPTTDSKIWDTYGIFKGSAFGSLGKSPSKEVFTIGKNEDGTMHLVASGNGKLSDTENGIIMYYYRLPSNTKFTLSAKAKVNEIDSNGQVGFGLMARDNMFIDKNDKTLNGLYVVAGTFGNGGSNCFYYKEDKLVKNSSSVKAPVANDVYDLQIVFNGEGYECTFGDNPTQIGGFDFKLTEIDDEYQYIGMFVSRNADITFSDIKLIVDGKEIDIMDTTVTPPDDPGPSGDDDLSMEGDGGNVSVTDGLLNGKKYGYKDVATFEVLSDMPFKEGVTNTQGVYDSYAITVDGTDYSGCVQGEVNGPDNNSIPSDGASAFKITALQDSKITFIVRQNNRNYWFTDAANTSETLQNIPKDQQVAGGASHTFYMREGHTYYFYAGGSKVMVAAISIAKSGEADSGWPFESAENPSQPSTEGTSQPSTEGTSQPSTEGSSQPSTEGSSQPSTEGSSQPSTENPSTPDTGEENPDTPSTKIPADEKIKTISINDKTKITIEAADVVYAKKQPYAITVTYKYEKKVGDNTQTYQQQLTEGLHYTVDAGSEDLSSEGVKTVTIKGTGKKTDLGTFINEEKTTYEVVAKKAKSDISKERNISLDKSDTKQSYTGNYITPIPNIGIEAVNAEGKANYKVVYKNNVNVGKASVTVIGQGDYYGTKVLPFTIAKTDLSKAELDITASNATITGSLKAYTAVDKTTNSSFEYKGAPVTLNAFKIALKSSGKTLRPQEDYTIAYKKNAQAGKATLTIKGANNFSGSIKIDFDIATNANVSSELEKFAPDKVTFESALPAEYSSKGARLTEINLSNGITLKENTDYKVKYGTDCKNATVGQTDLITVTITGAGSYKNVIAKNTPVAIKVVKGKFYIKDNTIVDAKKATSSDKLVTAAKIMDASGAKVKPAAVTLDKYEAPLTTIKVIPSDTDNYETTTLPCRVATKLSSVKLANTAKIADQPFDGVNSVTLTEQRIASYIGLDAKDIRIVSYKNNNKLGSATVTIEGTESGQYYGTRNLKFKIALTASDRDPEEEETSPSGGSTENPSEPSTGDVPNPSEPSTGDVPNPSEPSSGDDTNPSEPSSEENPDTEGSSSADPDQPTPPVQTEGKLIDVWDFGAKDETDTAVYRNHVTSEKWDELLPASDSEYPGRFAGAGEAQFGDLTVHFEKNDRIYKTTGKTEASDLPAIARFEYPDGYTAAGDYYCNGQGSASKRYIEIANVTAGDKIYVYVAMSNSGDMESGETLYFECTETGDKQEATVLTNVKLSFDAKSSGTYKIWTTNVATMKPGKSGGGKPIYNRVVRIPAVNVKGSIDKGPLESLEGVTLKFVNDATEVELPATIDGTSYTTSLSAGYTYTAVLSGATGYGFTNDSKKITTTENDVATGKNHDLVIETKQTYAYSGEVTGFAEGVDLSQLKVKLTTANDTITIVDYATSQTLSFNAMLEPDVEYTIVLEGVNDYEVKNGATISSNEALTKNIEVGLKDTQNVVGTFIDVDGQLLPANSVTALEFKNVDDEYTYPATVQDNSYTAQLREGNYIAVAEASDYKTTTHVKVENGMVSRNLLFVSTKTPESLPKKTDLYVGYSDKEEDNYKTVNKAIEAAKRMTTPTSESERITIHIAPGVYREQIIVDIPYISFVNDTPSQEVKLTWYYGYGYKYYSAVNGYYDKANAYDQYEKNAENVAEWGSTVILRASDFRAENIVFENSFNIYVTDEEIEDGVEPIDTKPARYLGFAADSSVAKERATAMNITKNTDRIEFYRCSFISCQDTLGTGVGTTHAYFKECMIEGNTDHVCGDGDIVFDNCEVRFAGYSDKGVGGYIAVAKDEAQKGYLFWNCTITGNSKRNVAAGDFGRPWSAGAQVTLVNTKLAGKNLIQGRGWTSMSNNEPQNAKYKEFNTTYLDGTAVDVSERVAGTVQETNPVNDMTEWFGSWTPTYYEAEETDILFETNPVITGEDTLCPGTTLSVSYALNGKNNSNDASIIKWYRVNDNSDETMIKQSTAVTDKTYRVQKADIGFKIGVEVTPITASGKTGTAESVVTEDKVTASEDGLGEGVKVFLAGDSTVKDYSSKGMWMSGKIRDEGSWGEFLQDFFDEEKVTIVNYAEGGRSTRSFINEGKFKQIEDAIGEGDYLFIQFGHNDSSNDKSYLGDRYVSVGEKGSDGKYPTTSPTKSPISELQNLDVSYFNNQTTKDNCIKNYGEEYYPYTSGTFKGYLQMYIDMAESKGAIPVLVTPVARMKYDKNTGEIILDGHHDSTKTTEGTVTSSGNAYVEAVKELAEENDVILIDAFSFTKDIFDAAYKADTGATNGKSPYAEQIMNTGDGTHCNKIGGFVEAACMAKAINAKNLNIASAIKTPKASSAMISDNKTAAFTVSNSGVFTAYDITNEYKTNVAYWSEVGTDLIEEIANLNTN